MLLAYVSISTLYFDKAKSGTHLLENLRLGGIMVVSFVVRNLGSYSRHPEQSV